MAKKEEVERERREKHTRATRVDMWGCEYLYANVDACVGACTHTCMRGHECSHVMWL